MGETRSFFNSEALRLADLEVGRLGKKEAFVPAGDPSMGALDPSQAQAAGGGGDPSQMAAAGGGGGMPPGGDPSQMGAQGGAVQAMAPMVQGLTQEAAMKPKIDEKLVLSQLVYMVALLCEKNGITVPPSMMVGAPQAAQNMAQSANTGGINPIQPIGGQQKQSEHLEQGTGFRRLSDSATVLSQMHAIKYRRAG